MPLDAAGFWPDRALFEQRRQNAGKIWSERSFYEFDLRAWNRRRGQYCALSWLAVTGFDGWIWTMTKEQQVPGWGGRKDFAAGAKYFGLTDNNCATLFSGRGDTRRLYHKFVWRITGKDVAEALLAAPYQLLPYEEWEVLHYGARLGYTPAVLSA